MQQATTALRGTEETLDAPFTATQPRSVTEPSEYPVTQRGQQVPIRKILAPTDFSPSSTEAVERAVAIANQCGAVLTILHVIDINRQISSGTARELMRDFWEEGSVRMARWAWSLANQAEVQTMLAEGLPWEVIVEKSRDFDLLVLGQGDLQTKRNFFSHHTAQRVIKHSACPVLVVPARA
jgi:nucleotide-binding universal stress UspA family protein